MDYVCNSKIQGEWLQRYIAFVYPYNMKFKNGVSVDKIEGYYRRDWQMPILEKANFKCTECKNSMPLIYRLPEGYVSLCRSCFLLNHWFRSAGRNNLILKAFKTESADLIGDRYGVSHQRIFQIIRRESEKQGLDFTAVVLKRKRESLKIAWQKNAKKFKHSWGSIEYRAS